MLQYYGYTISPNQIETGEGFLICKNVPIARTGDQEYLGKEIGLDGQDAGQVISVHRSPEEVFSQAALASFEGKPVTNDHPPDLIGPDDVGMYEKGHAQNVRRGSGEWADYIVADLHIHDRELIDAIQGGKREVSCGYECDYVSNGDGTYSQKNIRGNHIAVVDRGRAGKRAAILDSNKNMQAENPPERKKMSKHNAFLKLFGLAARDKSPEEIGQLADDAAEALSEREGKPSKDEPYKEKLYKKVDESMDEMMDKLLARDDLMEKLMAKMAAKKAAEEVMEDEDPLKATIEQLTGGEAEVQPGGGSEDGEEAHVVPAEEMDKTCGMDKALAAGILKAMRPTVAAIKDPKQRQAVSDALIKCVTSKDGASDIAKILEASKKNAKKVADSRPAMDLDAVQSAYDRLNPHNPNYGKEKK